MARRNHSSSSLAKARRGPGAAAVLVLMAAPLIVGGAVALSMMLLLSERSPVSGWLKSLFGSAVGAGSRTRAMRSALGSYVHGNGTLVMLREAVTGAGKGAVVNVFGPPRTAMLSRAGSAMSIWRSDTWYYPLDRTDRSVLAIRFEGNVARDVERVGIPTVSVE